MATTPKTTAPTVDESNTTGLPADAYKRAQESGGPDPVDPPVEPKKAEPHNIAPNEPYPTGGGYAEQGKPQNTPKDS